VRICGKTIAESDLEATVEASHAAIRAGSCRAFALNHHGEEVLVVVAEVERRSGGDRRSRHVNPRDGLESFWFEDRSERDRRRGQTPAMKIDDDEIACAIRDAVERSHGLQIREMVLTPPGVLPRTASGELDRAACGVRLQRAIEDEA